LWASRSGAPSFRCVQCLQSRSPSCLCASLLTSLPLRKMRAFVCRSNAGGRCARRYGLADLTYERKVFNALGFGGLNGAGAIQVGACAAAAHPRCRMSSLFTVVSVHAWCMCVCVCVCACLCVYVCARLCCVCVFVCVVGTVLVRLQHRRWPRPRLR
jgi:hypothetical protein